MSHIPFQLSDDGTHVEAHLVRSNPILKLLDAPQPAKLVVSVADCYVSPDWYGVPDQVKSAAKQGIASNPIGVEVNRLLDEM